MREADRDPGRLDDILKATDPGLRLRDRPSRNNVANSNGRCPTIGIFS